MSKESTKAAFQKAFSTHMLLNLSPEEEASIREYYGLEKPTPSEPQLRSKTQPSTNKKPPYNYLVNKESAIEALLNRLTKEELDRLAEVRSYAWCGTNWEAQERFRIGEILEARNPTPLPTPLMKQHPLKKLFHFWFS